MSNTTNTSLPLRATNNSLPFDTTTMLMLAFSGILVKLVLSLAGGTTKDGSSGPASATVWGYGLTSFAFIGLLLATLSLVTKETMNIGTWDTIKKVFSSSFPVVSTLVVLCWIIIINMTFMERINKGKVASDFNQFSLFSSILIIFQILIVFKYVLSTMGVTLAPPSNPTAVKIEQAFTKELNSITIIITLLNLIFAGMMQVVAEFFSTDG